MKVKAVLFLSKGFGDDHPMLLRWRSYYESRAIRFVSANVSWDMFSTNARKKLRLLLKWRLFIFINKVSYIHVNDLESGMVAAHLTRKFGIKYIYSANEIFSHELPLENEGAFTHEVKLKTEATVLRYARCVFIPNQQRIIAFERIHPSIPAGKYKIVENKSLTANGITVDKKFVDLLPTLPTVFYGGSFWYGRKQEDFPRLADDLVAVKCALVLSGGHNEYLQKLLVQTEHIHYVGNIPPEQFDDFIRHVDICLAWYYPTTLNDELCAPLKIFDFLKAGKQVVAPNLPYIKELEARFPGKILLFEPGNYDDCMKQILASFSYQTCLPALTSPLEWTSQYDTIDASLANFVHLQS